MQASGRTTCNSMLSTKIRVIPIDLKFRFSVLDCLKTPLYMLLFIIFSLKGVCVCTPCLWASLPCVIICADHCCRTQCTSRVFCRKKDMRGKSLLLWTLLSVHSWYCYHQCCIIIIFIVLLICPDLKHICQNLNQFGYGKGTKHGGLSEYTIIPSKYAYLLKTDLDDSRAAILERKLTTRIETCAKCTY